MNSPFSSWDDSSNSTHRAVLIENGLDALIVRIHLIRTAKKSVFLQTFAWANDIVGSFLLRELLAAAKRGIEVRVLVDGWTVAQHPGFWKDAFGVEDNFSAKIYNPPANRVQPDALDLAHSVLTDFEGLNHRMHSKTFIVDEALAICGGRNYEDDYYTLSATRNFKDRDVLVSGPSVPDFVESFHRFFQSSIAKDRETLFDVEADASGVLANVAGEGELEEALGHLEEKFLDASFLEKTFIENAYEVTDIQFVADAPGVCEGARDKANESVEHFLRLITETNESLLLQSPYFVLEESHLKALRDLRKRCKNCELIASTNSLASTDNTPAYAMAFRDRLTYLRELEIDLYEFKPHPQRFEEVLGCKPPRAELEAAATPEECKHLCLHAKTYVFDRRKTWIGSMNLDPRSAKLNTECGVVITDDVFSSDVADEIMKDSGAGNSWVVAFSQRGTFSAAFRKLFEDAGVLGEGAASAAFFTENYELKENAKPCSAREESFYDCYEPVGSFPLVQGSSDEIEARLLAALAGGGKKLV